ncbi:MAG: hypothetical protein ABL933_15545 [Methyloglobulus sp.]|nr:hypothetical protein [Methyloglobulus sp.]
MSVPAHQSKERIYAIVSRIIEDQDSLDLKPRGIALLVFIYDRFKTHPSAPTTLAESEVRSLHKRIEDLFLQDSATAELLASSAIDRLLKAHCLVRADINRLQNSDQELALTQLGESIAEWYLRQSEFNGESLTVILREFNSHLAIIAERASIAEFDEDWGKDVRQPIQYVLTEMLLSIRRHQSNLDGKHELIRETIPTLLSSEGEDSINQCENLLERVVTTITDLHHVTLNASNVAYSLIEKIEHLAGTCNEVTVIHACNDMVRHIDAVTEWTRQRQRDWVEHHNEVHRFIRTVTRVDSQRRLTAALKRGIVQVPQWTLVCTGEPKFFRFRDTEPERKERKAPKLARKDFHRETVEVPFDMLRDVLDSQLSEALANGEAKLSDLLKNQAQSGVPLRKLAFHTSWLLSRMIECGKLDNANKKLTSVYSGASVQELRVTKK